ncbi:putative glycosyltransferase [Rhypophila decipiens]|uniref:Glycosyltransferase n=1 Tax=Rhypophila decipiens TaxID=261697 RepID=A0AAN6Y6K5_9PEZI|nr:putative glycosyltransferase [Rhypophila decipiens]
MPFVSQRTLRNCLPLLVFLSLCLLLAATTRSLRNGAGLPKPSFRLGSHQKDGPARHAQQQGKQKTIPGQPSRLEDLKPGQCTPEMDFLRREQLGLTETIRYTRRCIRPIRSDKVDRNVLTNISSPLVDIAKMATINLTSCARTEIPPCKVLELHAPNRYPERTYPHLLFGIASSYARMESSIDAFATWLSGTGAQLYVIIQDADKHFLADLEQLYRDSGIEATFVPPPSLNPPKEAENPTIEHLHFLLVRSLLAFSTPGVTSWIGIIDDDTFLPHLYPLQTRILSQFNPQKAHWIGALSDDFNAISLWGFMAFGGAGVFLSIPLAREIEPHIETCIKRARIQSGDGILKECVYAYTRTKLSIVGGLYQHDIRGDVSGFYEGGLETPVSLHHWRSWYREEGLPRGVLVGREVCGGCWLQRFKFGGVAGDKQGQEGEGINDVLFVNGYSISEYFPAEGTWKAGPGGLDNIDLGRIEGTWGHAFNGEYDFSYGPLRRRLGAARKKSYKLVDVNLIKELRQIYVHRKSDAWQVEEGAMDEVIELIWEV